MFEILKIIVVGLGTLSIIVAIHEFGHYWVAKRCGVHVIRFSIGFGKPFWTKKDKSGTEFSLAPIPLGGYVQMLGESPDQAVDSKMRSMSFSDKSLAQRTAIVAAGPGINIILAILVYWGLFAGGSTAPVAIVAHIASDSPAAYSSLSAGDEIVGIDDKKISHLKDAQIALLAHIGESDTISIDYRRANSNALLQTQLEVTNFLGDNPEANPLKTLGIVTKPFNLPYIGRIIDGGAAQQAGLQKGDFLYAAEGERLYSWQEWVTFIRNHPGMEKIITVKRGEQQRNLDFKVRLASVPDGEKPYGQLGVGVDVSKTDKTLLKTVDYSLLESFEAAIERTWSFTTLTLRSIVNMISGSLSPKALSGPIRIVKITGQTADLGIRPYLELFALISLSLGIINLFPIPMLDGGQLLYFSYEAIRRRPLPINIQLAGNYVGIALLLTLMIFVIYNDIIGL